MTDMVNHPPHYASHPSGVEVWEFVQHLSFGIGNVCKYICRSNHKGSYRDDLKKSIWYADSAMNSSVPWVVGDLDEFNKKIVAYINAEPDDQTKGLLTVFTAAMNYRHVAGVETLGALVSSLEIILKGQV